MRRDLGGASVPKSWVAVFGFYGLFGFIVCVALVLAAKWMRTFLMRPEDYYDPDG